MEGPRFDELTIFVGGWENIFLPPLVSKSKYFSMNFFRYSILLLSFSCSAVFAQSPKRFVQEGNQAYEKKAFTDAFEAYGRAISLEATNFEALLGRANSAVALNKLQLAESDFNQCMKLDPKRAESYAGMASLLFQTKRYEEALRIAEQGLAIERKSDNLLGTAAQSAFCCNKFPASIGYSERWMRETDNKALVHLVWATALDSAHQLAESLEHIQKALSLVQNAKEPLEAGLYARVTAYASEVMVRMGKSKEALATLDKAILKEPQSQVLWNARGRVFFVAGQYSESVDAYSQAILIDGKMAQAFLGRSQAFQTMGNLQSAMADAKQSASLQPSSFEAWMLLCQLGMSNKKFDVAQQALASAEKLNPQSSAIPTLKTQLENQIFESKREPRSPVLHLDDARMSSTPPELPYNPDQDSLLISGWIQEESALIVTKVNDNPLAVTNKGGKWAFKVNLFVKNRTHVSFHLEDAYHNITETAFRLVKGDRSAPVLLLDLPPINANGEIEINDQTGFNILVNGKVEDESLIRKIEVNGLSATFSKNQPNPTFSMKLDVVGRDSLRILVEDSNGNASKKSIVLKRSSENSTAVNPMGKTWVVFIDNSHYQALPRLEATTQDVVAMKNALAGYTIDKILVRNDLTKAEMERYFSIELRDLVAQNQVNSLLVWFAGHGRFINETGYWLPIDANRKDESTFYSLIQLKAHLSTYKKVSHTLVVSDACETGPAFYLAMRDTDKPRNCGDWESTKLKSAQVFSSTTLDLNDDKSVFTKTFANVLKGTSDRCISIDRISEEVAATAKLAKKPKPKLGNISGLLDENGSFFFIRK